MSDFPFEGFEILKDAEAGDWCHEHLDDFVQVLLQNFAPEELTKGNIRESAKNYIVEHQNDEDFAAIVRKADGTDGLFLGLVIKVMSDYMLHLVIQRG